MKNFLAIFREPDGRTIAHSDEFMKSHQENWKNWLALWGQKGHLNGGSGLTLDGRIIQSDGSFTEGVHKTGTEIVGGYLLLKAEDFDEASEILKTCPIFEFGGYIELRELQNQG